MSSFTDPEENLASYGSWLILDRDGKPQQLPYKQRKHGQYLLAQFENCEDRDLCRRYTNLKIAVTADQLPETAEGEYYWKDLEGLTVKTEQGELLGHIDHLFATGANDVIVVKGKKKHLIPYIDHFILDINLENSLMIVDWDTSEET